MPKEFRPLFRMGKVNARVRKKGNGYEVRCQVDGERISVYGKLLYEAKAKFIVKLAELRSPSRPRKRNSVLLDKKLYISGKTRHSRTVEKKFFNVSGGRKTLKVSESCKKLHENRRVDARNSQQFH